MINIKATNMDLTEAIQDYVEKKIAHAEKFVSSGSIERRYVDVGRTTNHHKQGEIFRAEFRLVVGGKTFFAFAEKDDLYAAVDEAANELSRELSENKSRGRTLFRRGAQKIKQLVKSVPNFYHRTRKE